MAVTTQDTDLLGLIQIRSNSGLSQPGIQPQEGKGFSFGSFTSLQDMKIIFYLFSFFYMVIFQSEIMYSQRNFYNVVLPGLLLSVWSYGVNTLFNLLLENASRQCCRSTSVKCCVCYPTFPGHICSPPDIPQAMNLHLCTSVYTVIMGVLSGLWINLPVHSKPQRGWAGHCTGSSLPCLGGAEGQPS